jgi:hypothetical protein
VNVNAIVFPVEPLPTFAVVVVSVPAPSAESTVMLGELERFVNVPLLVDFSCVVQLAAPAVVGAVAPGPLEALLPYVIFNVLFADRDKLDTVIVRLLTDRLPVDAVV